MTKEKIEEGVVETSLYGGKITVKFMGPTDTKPSRHIYMMNGQRTRSVTGIIGLKDKSMALVPWSQEETAKCLLQVLEAKAVIDREQIIRGAFASDRAKEKAASLGSAVHDWCEEYINHKLKKGKNPGMPNDPAVISGVTSFMEWEESNQVKFLWSEKVLYSRKHDYMGKADFGAIVNGERCICDLKTGNGMYKEVRLQLAAYRFADEEETKIKYDGRWAIQIAKETEQEYYARMELKNQIKIFLGKSKSEIYPYKVFNAKFLDIDKKDYKNDMDCFINLAGIHSWDANTTL